VSFTRIALICLVPLAIVVGLRASALAAVSLKMWQAGDTLTSTDLNANFSAINAAMVDQTSTQTVAGAKTFTSRTTFSADIDVGYTSLTFNLSGTLPPECASTGGTYTDCKCPAGTAVISGGAYAGANMFVDESRDVSGSCMTGATDSCWRTACANSSGTRAKCVYANIVCARIKR
jgi:hypothetical protein